MLRSALLLLAASAASAQNLPPGVYPGAPTENRAPSLGPGPSQTRNLALLRPAWHSSAYDYNLTAQLVTDGIKERRAPRWIAVSTSDHGVLKKNAREWLLDGNWVSNLELKGRSPWIQFEIGGEPPEIDRVMLDGSVRAQNSDNQQWDCRVLGSDDGEKWTELGQTGSIARPTGEIRGNAGFRAPARHRFYRLQFHNGRPLNWTLGEVGFLRGDKRVELGGPFHFTSAWKSAGAGEEWVSVDLGAKSRIERVALTWIEKAAAGSLQVSDDGRSWRTVHALDSDDIKLPQSVDGRYVRVLMTKANAADGYVLSELEVFGTGGVTVRPRPAGELGTWRVQRDSLVSAGGGVLSQRGFADSGWLVATVPATTLVSYLNAGALPDPNFGDNQLMISDSFFHADFWYRTEFPSPAAKPGRRTWLNFDGVNWKADVWLNGARLGRIDGGFLRGRFDVTGKLRAKNALAVRVEKNAHPGSVKEKTFENPDKNGGVLGADNPTYHASIGWDWIPTIRGRNTGLWNDVYLTHTGGVTVDDPVVTSKVQSPSRAEVTVEAILQNHDATMKTGMLRGRFGEQSFNVPVSLGANQTLPVRHTLALDNPRLWWPNGYGEPYLYTVELQFGDSDAKTFRAGVREFKYSEEGGALRIWVNGRRFVPRGGNWGFPESMLRYRAREYEAAMRYHRDMNFTMIRNWVGQTGDNELYEAADRNGIVIMQDFWLANPWDGPDPDDNAMFMANVKDTVRRIRHHASVGLYCGRNEGYPLKPLDDAIRAALAELHPDIHYIPSSADDVVSGHGPYRAQDLKQYFTERATPKFHSEMGMPNILTMDSLRLTMREEDMWPLGRVWGLHDFCLTGAQGGASFLARIEKSYGGASDIREWNQLAQFINYEGHRAMFEAQSKNRMGLLIWMSHPAWPSMVWQTYDYFLEPTAAYFGAKKAAEPLHIQWNPATEKVEVVNYNAGDRSGLAATVEVFGLDGKRVWTKSASLESKEDSVASPIAMEYPAGVSPVHFLRLRLSEAGRTVSENFYWRGTETENYRALRQLPPVQVTAKTSVERSGDKWVLTTELANVSDAPALMVRLKAVRENSGDRILPVFYEDNYVSLMPGDRRTIRTELLDADARGERPALVIEGFNLSR